MGGGFFFWVYSYCCPVAQSCLIPWTAAHQASLSITNSQSLLKLMSIQSVMPSKHLILCCLLLLLTSIFSSIKVFSNELALRIRWPKYWSFSFSISPSNVYSGLISFRMNWFDLLAVQGTLKSLLHHHSSEAQFFGIQLSLCSNSLWSLFVCLSLYWDVKLWKWGGHERKTETQTEKSWQRKESDYSV